MATEREQHPGIYHITSRGVDGRDVYLGVDTRLAHRRLLTRGVKKHGVAIHAECQMWNHFHLVLETFEHGQLSDFMQYVNSTYARIFNEIAGRRGYLFEQPFKSKPVESEGHALELCRYIVLNPLRSPARILPKDWRWSSYWATLGLVSRPEYLKTSWVLQQFDGNEEKARVKYALFVEEGVQKTLDDLAKKDMSILRTADMSQRDTRLAA